MATFFILQGLPGSGKGTQVALLESRRNFTKVSCGDLIRKHVREKTKFGQLASECIKSGQLVPDEDICAVFLDHLVSFCEIRQYVIDGFPRSLKQAASLQQFFENGHHMLARVIYLDVPPLELERRLRNRRVCSVCDKTYNLKTDRPKVSGHCDVDGARLSQRADDKPGIVSVRLKHYLAAERQVTTFYGHAGLLFAVSACGSVEDVFTRVTDALDST